MPGYIQMQHVWFWAKRQNCTSSVKVTGIGTDYNNGNRLRRQGLIE